jgi:hypothetical protein
METTKQEEERRKKPKLEDQEGMPQHQHCIAPTLNQHFMLRRGFSYF